MRHARLLHVAQDAKGEVGGRPAEAVGGLELARQGGRRRAEAAATDARAAALAVRDEGDIAEALVDGGGGVAHMQHERAAANGGAVDPGGGDAEVVGDARGRLARGGHAVDVAGHDAAVLHGVEGGIGVKLDLGEAGDAAELGGLGGSDNGDGTGLHG